MKHFVGYHNFERMEAAQEVEPDAETTKEPEAADDESSLENEEGPRFGFVTRKKPDRFVGNVIWAIQGQGKPREYYLLDWFIVDGFTDLSDERFAAQVYGSDGESFPDGIYLNEQEWFPEFRKVNSNFSLGIQEIAPKFLKRLCELTRSEGFPLPPGCDEILAAQAPLGEAGPIPESGGLSEIAVGQATPERRAVTVERIVRDTAITLEVKRLHEHRCQICGVRLDTPEGPYAQCAHIRPLGSPHDGPDVLSNVLCLCPNHHVLFDCGAMSITDDLRLIGLEGTLRVVPGHLLSPEYLRYHRE